MKDFKSFYEIHSMLNPIKYFNFTNKYYLKIHSNLKRKLHRNNAFATQELRRSTSDYTKATWVYAGLRESLQEMLHKIKTVFIFI